jgi:hypothetical protein
MRLLDLQDNDFQISVPRGPTHYTPQGSGDVLGTVGHRNVRLSDVTVSDILDSDHLPILFHILDHASARDVLTPAEIHTGRERFRSLASDLISPRSQIDTADDAKRAACNFAASTASAYRLSTRKITLSELNNELPELDRLLKFKWRLRKLWHETKQLTGSPRLSAEWPGGRHLNDGKTKWVTVRSRLKQSGLLRSTSWRGTDKRHQPLFMVLWAPNFSR